MTVGETALIGRGRKTLEVICSTGRKISLRRVAQPGAGEAKVLRCAVEALACTHGTRGPGAGDCYRSGDISGGS